MAGPSKGSKPDKILKDALIIELNREDIEDGVKIKRINRIVHKLVSAAVNGDLSAIKEVWDRVEGKAVQPTDNKTEVVHNYVARLPDQASTASQWQQKHKPSQTIQ